MIAPAFVFSIAITLVVSLSPPSNLLRKEAADCSPAGTSYPHSGANWPLVLLSPAPATGGNSNGPGCDGCTLWASGIVVWGENGTGVIVYPNGAATELDITAVETTNFGGGKYAVACGEDAEWHFISNTSGGVLLSHCSECQ